MGTAASQEAGCLEHSVIAQTISDRHEVVPNTFIAELPVPIILICLVPFLALLLQLSSPLPFCVK
jgi:hypothetical protein